ncbi:MAG: hypothetical protein IAI49_15015 [Candidatus Eremiobacteraeota bacterium]|nr:hypothetical protein [Candidatus Eremiobacteraeota bacterium]
MFPRRRPPDHEGRTSLSLNSVRDVVEIVAIVAAGAWAFYTFVYENQIKPAYSKPEVELVSTLTMLGERNGLVAVQSHVVVKNVGTTYVWLYGFAETVLGSTVRARRADSVRPLAAHATDLELEPEWTAGKLYPVYSLGLLTALADPGATAQFNFSPGQSIPFDRVFYVAARRFDELRTHLNVRYSATPAPVAYHLKTVDGIIHLASAPNAPFDGLDDTTATLSLWR